MRNFEYHTTIHFTGSPGIQPFDFSALTRVALIHNGKVINSNLPHVAFGELEHALATCKEASECDLRLRGANWISLPPGFLW
jgi:hypothetical protein